MIERTSELHKLLDKDGNIIQEYYVRKLCCCYDEVPIEERCKGFCEKPLKHRMTREMLDNWKPIHE